MNDHVKAGAQPQDSGADWGSEVMAGGEPRAQVPPGRGPCPGLQAPEGQNKAELTLNCQWHTFASEHSCLSFHSAPWVLLSLAEHSTHQRAQATREPGGKTPPAFPPASQWPAAEGGSLSLLPLRILSLTHQRSQRPRREKEGPPLPP